ncbi:beta-phosphoglucomutase family hydrolase [Mycolicibacter virginiensis]|uniref:beta-phosphoglucomutase family hydrolase n=1 Tax=Mycolicibacter virginiensis TaxID=1795032 RepID=UPI001F03434A|nr:beta-phosphoglucomutase family hydrolase [Mycolicibacter virginiensis]ULP46733.1 beta-phosphoglucomutase family hydrolase [Mycolicibacter virginiensis]
MVKCRHAGSPEGEHVLGLPETVRACLFDLDGVLTDTASVHTRAWKSMFDAYLSARAERTGEPFVPFDAQGDYRRFVDGRKRDDGVRAFLVSRGITLPDGADDDPPDAETVHGLGNRKNEAFRVTLQADGVEVFEGSRRYLAAVTAAGLATAVVSASANAGDVLALTGLEKFIAQRVDGVTLRAEHIAGKPAPDSFLRAAQLLGVTPTAAAVFEDALSGVAAGRAGGFGFVVGVDRVGQRDDLLSHGADVVVTDLDQLL